MTKARTFSWIFRKVDVGGDGDAIGLFFLFLLFLLFPDIYTLDEIRWSRLKKPEKEGCFQ